MTSPFFTRVARNWLKKQAMGTYGFFQTDLGRELARPLKAWAKDTLIPKPLILTAKEKEQQKIDALVEKAQRATLLLNRPHVMIAPDAALLPPSESAPEALSEKPTPAPKEPASATPPATLEQEEQ